MNQHCPTTIGTTVLLAATLGIWAIWSIRLLGWALPVATTEAAWLGIGMVEDHATIATGHRVALALAVSGIWAAGSWAFWAAARRLWLYRGGAYFTDASVRAIRGLGLALIAAMLVDTAYTAIWPTLVTLPNTGLPGILQGGAASPVLPVRAPALRYDPGDVSLALCGLGVWLIGGVLALARAYETAARSYV
ncbi:MAG: hypothetical protein ACU0CO_10025 [Shimia sp.]